MTQTLHLMIQINKFEKWIEILKKFKLSHRKNKQERCKLLEK